MEETVSFLVFAAAQWSGVAVTRQERRKMPVGWIHIGIASASQKFELMFYVCSK